MTEPKGALTKREFLNLKAGTILYKVRPYADEPLVKTTLQSDATMDITRLFSDHGLDPNLYFDAFTRRPVWRLFLNYWEARAYYFKTKATDEKAS